MKRGLIQNSVQVAKLTIAVQYLQEKNKTHIAQTAQKKKKKIKGAVPQMPPKLKYHISFHQ